MKYYISFNLKILHDSMNVRDIFPEGTPFVLGHCKSWTLDSGLDRGLDCGLYYGLIFGLDSEPSSASVTTISYRVYQHTRKIG